jgi:hypothetical protein
VTGGLTDGPPFLADYSAVILDETGELDLFLPVLAD